MIQTINLIPFLPVLHMLMCVCLGLCSFITCADLCNYHHSQIENSPIAKIPLVTHIHLLLSPLQFLQTIHLFSISIILLFQEFI